jgi:hypothetical protein
VELVEDGGEVVLLVPGGDEHEGVRHRDIVGPASPAALQITLCSGGEFRPGRGLGRLDRVSRM